MKQTNCFTIWFLFSLVIIIEIGPQKKTVWKTYWVLTRPKFLNLFWTAFDNDRLEPVSWSLLTRHVCFAQSSSLAASFCTDHTWLPKSFQYFPAYWLVLKKGWGILELQSPPSLPFVTSFHQFTTGVGGPSTSLSKGSRERLIPLRPKNIVFFSSAVSQLVLEL